MCQNHQKYTAAWVPPGSSRGLFSGPLTFRKTHLFEKGPRSEKNLNFQDTDAFEPQKGAPRNFGVPRIPRKSLKKSPKVTPKPTLEKPATLFSSWVEKARFVENKRDPFGFVMHISLYLCDLRAGKDRISAFI
jgi:hypothetical protein